MINPRKGESPSPKVIRWKAIFRVASEKIWINGPVSFAGFHSFNESQSPIGVGEMFRNSLTSATIGILFFFFLGCSFAVYIGLRLTTELEPLEAPLQPEPRKIIMELIIGSTPWSLPFALESELGIRFPLLPAHAACGNAREIELGIVFRKVFSARAGR